MADVVVRILISLVLGVPSLALWLVLRAFAKSRGELPTGLGDWLKVITAVAIGLAVILDAMDKRLLAHAFNLNSCGLLLILTWAQKWGKANQSAPTLLNISGREPFSSR